MNESAGQPGWYLVIARAVASLVLGLIVFVGLLYFVVLTNISSKLLDHEFYNGILVDADTYNRVYEVVVTETELIDEAGYPVGNAGIISDEDKVSLLREVFPPEYLRSQTEGFIESLVSYMAGEADELEIVVEFGQPIENLRPAAYAYMDRRIDALEEEDTPEPPECSRDAVEQLAAGFQKRWEQLAEGDIPSSIPSLNSLDQLCRALVFEAVFIALPTVTTQVSLTDDVLRQALRQAFDDADARQAVKVLARPLSEPFIDDAIEEFRSELEPGDRLDLISKFAEEEGVSEEDVRQSAAEIRDGVSFFRGLSRTLALVIVAVGAAIIGALHLPRPGPMLGWPGITLLLSGAVCYVVGRVAHSQLDQQLMSAVDSSPQLTVDVAGFFSQRLTSGFAGPAIIIMVVGALLIVASLAVLFFRARRSNSSSASPT